MVNVRGKYYSCVQRKLVGVGEEEATISVWRSPLRLAGYVMVFVHEGKTLASDLEGKTCSACF